MSDCKCTCGHDQSDHWFDGGKCMTGKCLCACPRFAPALSQKQDAAKLRYSLLPWRALDEVVRVLEHGAGKYGDDNWRQLEDGHRRYLDAALRHVAAVLKGERMDTESGRDHLAHAVCSLLFAMELA